MWVSVTMSLFPITYLLAAVRAIDSQTTAALFQLLSMAIKGFYGAVILDLQSDAVVVSNWTLQQEIRANNARRSYLKYVFHEVRNPLNSLALGIDILEQSATPREEIERFAQYEMQLCRTNNIIFHFVSQGVPDDHAQRLRVHVCHAE